MGCDDCDLKIPAASFLGHLVGPSYYYCYCIVVCDLVGEGIALMGI